MTQPAFPNNLQIFMAAYAGAVAGARERLKLAFRDDSGCIPAAQLLAIALDSAWANVGNPPANTMNVLTMNDAASQLMRETDPNFILSATVGGWANFAADIVDFVIAADTGTPVDFTNIGFVFASTVPSNWGGIPPADTNNAIDRIASQLALISGPITGPTGPTSFTGPTGLTGGTGATGPTGPATFPF